MFYFYIFFFITNTFLKLRLIQIKMRFSSELIAVKFKTSFDILNVLYFNN